MDHKLDVKDVNIKNANKHGFSFEDLNGYVSKVIHMLDNISQEERISVLVAAKAVCEAWYVLDSGSRQ